MAAQAARVQEWAARYREGKLLPGEGAFYAALPPEPGHPTLIRTSDGVPYGVARDGSIRRGITRLSNGESRKIKPPRRRVLLAMAKKRAAQALAL